MDTLQTEHTLKAARELLEDLEWYLTTAEEEGVDEWFKAYMRNAIRDLELATGKPIA